MKLKNKKGFLLILTLVLLLTVVTACTSKDKGQADKGEEAPVTKNEEFPMTVKDGFENDVVLEKAPEKIVSTAPNKTEILFALGLDEKIVGVSTSDDYPAKALEKEQVASYEGLNLERVIELETDLVVSFGDMRENNPDDFKKLEESGIPVLSYGPESIDEVIETISLIGEATGTIDKAKEIIDGMMEKKEEVVTKIQDAEKKTVFYEVWGDPLQTTGKGSFMDEFITLGGGENIAGDIDEAYPQYNLEELSLKDPELYIISDGDPELTEDTIKERPGYAGLSAIKNNNIFLVDANLVSRPGPRIVEGLELIAKTIHPQLFE